MEPDCIFKWTNYFGNLFQSFSSVQFLASCVSLLFYFYELASKIVYPHCLIFHLPSVNWFLSFPIPNECLIVYMATFALCLCVYTCACVHAHRAHRGESSRRDCTSSSVALWCLLPFRQDLPLTLKVSFPVRKCEQSFCLCLLVCAQQALFPPSWLLN